MRWRTGCHQQSHPWVPTVMEANVLVRDEIVNIDDIPMDGEMKKLIEQAQEAWSSLKRVDSWEQWKIVAFAVDGGRHEIMRLLHINDPTGAQYSRAMGAWLSHYGFGDIDKSARSYLQKCLDNLTEIEKWRSNILNQSHRVKLNHPQTVYSNWQKTKKAAVNKSNPRTNAKDEVIRKLQEELDGAQQTISEMVATEKRQAEKVEAENPPRQDIMAELICEGDRDRPQTIDDGARNKIEKILQGMFHPRNSIGDVVTRLRGYHRLAYGWTPSELEDVSFERMREAIVDLEANNAKLVAENDRLAGENDKLRGDNTKMKEGRRTTRSRQTASERVSR